MADHRDVHPFNPATVMSMRDHLAAQALSGLLANGHSGQGAARMAVEAADYLIEALRGTPVPPTSPGSGP